METNYKIIGGDGREYGPVTLDELKSWVRDGRVGRQTQILRNDQSSWLPASQFQELQAEMATLPASATEIEDEFRPVGFWMRVIAYVIDQITLVAVSYAIFGRPIEPDSTTFEWGQIFNARFAYDMLTAVAYYTALNGYFGATLGKMVVGAKIVNLDGSRIGYLKAFLRFFASVLRAILCLAGYIMVAFREDKRGLHDLIVGTRVIYKR